jgi:zona occludens toxin (predicted ATPase)
LPTEPQEKKPDRSGLVDAEAAPSQHTQRPGGNHSQTEKGRVIVYLKNRHHTLTVYAGERFSVTSNDGTILAADMTADEFQRQHPAIHELYRTSFAWAGL